MTRRRRQYEHILDSFLERGMSMKLARKRAAMTVNAYRSRLATGYWRCKKRRCAWKKGPRLVGHGGSRNQWWPGKRRKRPAGRPHAT